MSKIRRLCPALVTRQPFYLIQIRHCLADKNVVHVGLHLGVQKPQELLLGQLQVLVPGNIIVRIYTNRWLNRGIVRNSRPFPYALAVSPHYFPLYCRWLNVKIFANIYSSSDSHHQMANLG